MCVVTPEIIERVDAWIGARVPDATARWWRSSRRTTFRAHASAAERDGVALVKRMPVVDVLCGPGELDKLPSLLDNAYRTRQSLLADRVTATDAEEVFA